MDFAFALALLGVVMYLLLRTRRLKKRLVVAEEQTVKREVIVIRYGFDGELLANPEMTVSMPTAAGE